MWLHENGLLGKLRYSFFPLKSKGSPRCKIHTLFWEGGSYVYSDLVGYQTSDIRHQTFMDHHYQTMNPPPPTP